MQQDDLIKKFVPLAVSVSNKYRTLPFDDRKQEALLGLVIAAKSYDKAKGDFPQYAVSVISNRLNKMYNVEVMVPNLGETGDFEVDFEEYFDESVDEFGVSEILMLASSMSMFVVKLTAAKFAGYSQKECAKILGVTQSCVSKQLKALYEEITKNEEKMG